MTPSKVPPGADRVARGQKSKKRESVRSSVHSPGTQTEAEHNKIASAGEGQTIKISSGGKK